MKKRWFLDVGDTADKPTKPSSRQDAFYDRQVNILYGAADDMTWQALSSGGGGIESVVAGTGINVDATDPLNPIVSLTVVGSQITVGNYADTRPAAPNPGDTFIARDGWYPEIYDSAWIPYQNGQALARPPVAASWTLINIGGAALTDSTGTLLLTAPALTSDSLSIAVLTPPTAPYTWIAQLEVTMESQPYIGAGLILHDSGSNHSITYGWYNDSALNWRIVKYSDYASYDGDYALPAQPQFVTQRLWAKISDDGTNYTFAYSWDGRVWIAPVTQPNTDYVTADGLGIYVDNKSGSGAPDVTLRVNSWLIS